MPKGTMLEIYRTMFAALPTFELDLAVCIFPGCLKSILSRLVSATLCQGFAFFSSASMFFMNSLFMSHELAKPHP